MLAQVSRDQYQVELFQVPSEGQVALIAEGQTHLPNSDGTLADLHLGQKMNGMNILVCFIYA